MVTQEQRAVNLNKDQLLAAFTMLLTGQLNILTPNIPPHEIAQQLLDRASVLVAALQPDAVRQSITKILTDKFALSVETNAIAMRTTPGGVIVPINGRVPS